jgi:hypothetical protein
MSSYSRGVLKLRAGVFELAKWIDINRVRREQSCIRLCVTFVERVHILRPLHDRQVSDSMRETALEWGDGAA